jgi:hypothetical protein
MDLDLAISAQSCGEELDVCFLRDRFVTSDVARRLLLGMIQNSVPSLPSFMHGTAEDHARSLRGEKLKLTEL